MFSRMRRISEQSLLRNMRRLLSYAIHRSAAPSGEAIAPLLPTTSERQVEPFFAEKAVDVTNMTSFRSEYFPSVGPYPWLDQPDVEQQLAAKLRDGLLSSHEAEQCRTWIKDGYIIIPGLIE